MAKSIDSGNQKSMDSGNQKSMDSGNQKSMDSGNHDLERLKEELTGEDLRVFDQVKKAAEYLLKKKKILSEEKAISGRSIYEEYNKIRNKLKNLPDINYNSFLVYLSRIANSPDSSIICLGRRRGYYWNENFEPIKSVEVDSIENLAGLASNVNIKEADLYDAVKTWLFEKCDRVQIISSMIGNKLWGNPDLVGFKFYDILNDTSFEIFTVEVKLTPDSWRRWIFEAVAHTRFADRSYFAFLYPETWLPKLEGEGMRLYAEHFRIGLLVLAINEDMYKKIRGGNMNKNELKNLEIDAIEFYQAPPTRSHPKFKNEFLKNLGIEKYIHLHQFGDDIK